MSSSNSAAKQGPASLQKRRMPYLQMTSSNAQAASTPELLAGIIPELFEHGSRPRSWSARGDGTTTRQAIDESCSRGSRRNSTLERTSTPPPLSTSSTLPCRADVEKTSGSFHAYRAQRETMSLRAVSIRSSARDSTLASEGPLDSLTSQSQPQVATALSARSSSSRPIEARGQIVSNQPSSARSRTSSYSTAGASGRKQALGILRPLATKSSQDDIGRSAKEISSIAASAASESAITAISAITALTKPMPENGCLAAAAADVFGIDGAIVANDASDSSSTHSSAKHIDNGLIRRGLRSKAVVEPVAGNFMLSEGPPSDGRGSDLPGQKQKQHQEQEQPGLNTKDIAGGQGVSIWSRIAKLSIKRISLTSEAQTAGDSHLNGQTSQQKAAIDQLREIEASQPAETGIAANKGPDAVSDADFGADASGTAISAEPSNPTSDSPVSETGADGGTLAHSGDNKSTDMTIAQEAGSSNSEAGIREDSVDTGQSDDPSKQAAEARSGWLWGWIGSSKPELGGNMASASSAAAATSTGAVSKNDFPNASPHADDTLSQARSVAANDKHQERSLDSASRPLSAAGDQSLKPPTSRTSQALSEADTAISHGHNTQQQSNVLLPDLDIGQRSNDYAHVPDCADSAQTVDGSLGEEDCTADSAESKHYADEKPLRKRLRTMGKSVMDMFVDMAPDWAQNAVRGQNRADKLGQRQGTSSAHADGQMTSQQIRETMDRTANSLGRIAVVGIHGWFPIRMLQMIAGEPTGKSERFCLMMRDALKSYLSEQHGVEIADKDISLFPLVGEGRIEDRVELLLSQIVDSGEQHEQPRSDAAMDAATAGSPSRAESTSGHHTGTGDRPSALASASASGSMPAATGKQKGKPALVSAAKEKEPGSTADGNGSPAGKQSAMIAEALMPERSKRAQVLQEADTVFVVTHSQGTPVSAMLLERLLELGIIDTSRQRVAMLAMAGISHGPFPYLKDNLVIRYIESEAARELFELMDPSSYQSQRYVAALSMILHKGVRLICAGSWVDEVVPLYSAILQGVSHPNVYRAVYIDAPHYADDFLTNLIAFALRLRNMDIYDHDLLIHLSEVVAGSLWGHWGHSTVYGEPAVYKLSVKWLLYSTSCTSVSASASASVPAAAMGMAAAGHQSHAQASVSGMQIHMSYRPFNAGDKLNPFFIPWIMRTLWDEPEIRQNDSLRIELRRLVALFDKWMPETKAGKELKYRLEPVRAAL